MAQYLKVRNRWLIKVVDRDGNEQAEATEENTENGWSLQITHNAIQIGQISLFTQGTNQYVLQSNNSTIYEKSSKPGGIAIFQYFDKSEAEVAGIWHYMGPLVKLEMRKHLTSDEKILLLCRSINRAQLVYKINNRIPRILPISVITCDCSLCEECRNNGGTALFHSSIEKLYIRAAGYNRMKNLVYFDVFGDSPSFVIHTVECTPRDNQKGIVKLVVKNRWSNILWTTVQLPGDLFAFYSKENNLLGYQWKNLILNAQHEEVMHIEKQNYTYKAGFQQEPSHKVKFVIFNNDNFIVAVVIEESNCTSIYRPSPRLKTGKLSKLELIFLIPFAVKINSVAYKIDEWPLPEITYHYKNAREPGKFVF